MSAITSVNPNQLLSMPPVMSRILTYSKLADIQALANTAKPLNTGTVMFVNQEMEQFLTNCVESIKRYVPLEQTEALNQLKSELKETKSGFGTLEPIYSAKTQLPAAIYALYAQSFHPLNEIPPPRFIKNIALDGISKLLLEANEIPAGNKKKAEALETISLTLTYLGEIDRALDVAKTIGEVGIHSAPKRKRNVQSTIIVNLLIAGKMDKALEILNSMDDEEVNLACKDILNRLVGSSRFNLAIDVAQKLNGLEQADAFALISIKLLVHIRNFNVPSDPDKDLQLPKTKTHLEKGEIDEAIKTAKNMTYGAKKVEALNAITKTLYSRLDI